ncbi:unnamed protein product [Arctogadus glacialis]
MVWLWEFQKLLEAGLIELVNAAPTCCPWTPPFQACPGHGSTGIDRDPGERLYRLSSDCCCAAIDAATVTASKALGARLQSDALFRRWQLPGDSDGGYTAALESAKLQAEPLKVQGHQRSCAPLGPATFCLSDGSSWHPSHLREVALSAATHLGAHIDSGFIAGALDFPAEQLSAPAGRLQLTLLSDQVVST